MCVLFVQRFVQSFDPVHLERQILVHATSAQTSAARQIAAFATTSTRERMPAEVTAMAKLHVLDALGCGLAASGLGLGLEGRSVASAMGGTEEATVIGDGCRLPAPGAALANGMLIHALDFDDTHSDSIAHVSAVVVPAAIAVSEAVEASGHDFLSAVVIGNEVVSRIGMAASSEFHARGFHPTSVAGVFGATAAAAYLMNADEDTTTSALGIAGSLASGLFAYLEDGTPTKPIHAGWAAHAGLLAMRLAQAGALGPEHVLEGRHGLYDAFVGRRVDISGELADLGSRWETLRIAFKAFPSCHYMHGVLCAAETLSLAAEDIVEVIAVVPAAAVALVCEPQEAKIAPRTSYEAKFSVQFSIAAFLLQGCVGLPTYTPAAIADAEILNLARRVRYEVADFPTYPAAFPGAVRVILRSGEVIEATCPFQRGGLENPMTSEDVRRKFRENAGLALDQAQVDELEAAVLSLEQWAAADVFPLLSAARTVVAG